MRDQQTKEKRGITLVGSDSADMVKLVENLSILTSYREILHRTIGQKGISPYLAKELIATDKNILTAESLVDKIEKEQCSNKKEQGKKKRQGDRGEREHGLSREGQITAQLILQEQIAAHKERAAEHRAREAKIACIQAIQNLDDSEVKRQIEYFKNLQIVRTMVLSMLVGLLFCICTGKLDLNEDSKLDELLFLVAALLFSPKLFKALAFDLREGRRMQRQNINL